MTVRVRFAPSPTGHLHVGGARTALFNWLFARKNNGTFVLRIEDTDQERSDPKLARGIIDGLSWMGLDWDEGPYYQSERSGRHREVVRDLLASGHAYHCFCSHDQLTVKRSDAQRSKGDWKYDRTCLSLSDQDVRKRLNRGETAAIRFHVPKGPVVFKDLVFGDIKKDGEELEDFVLQRTDGQPTYHLSVVVDDSDMSLTHVVRGADHISNTPKQLLLYRAIGASPPQFVHLPLILGSDKSRLSKRHGAKSVLAYRDEGVLAEAFNNFLALMGWSDGTDRELFERDDLIKAFSLEGVSRTNAVFDADKLAWFAGQYIQLLPVDELIRLLRPFLVDAGLWDEERFAGSDREWFRSLIRLIRPRFRFLKDLAAEVGTYTGGPLEYDHSAIERFMKDTRLRSYLPELARRLESVDSFDLDETERALRSLAEQLGVKAGLLINAARVSLTGKAVAPGIFEVMVALGRQLTLERLRQAALLVPKPPP